MSERLKKYEFFKHCLRLKAQGFTGTVVIERSDGNTVIRFDGGVPFHAASEDVTLSFAGLLIRRALLDPSTLKRLLEESLEQHIKLETLLVDQGRMTSKEVWKTKRELSSLVFQHAFTVDDMSMRLIPGDSPDEEALSARSELEVYETLFRAVMGAPDRNVFLGLFRDRWDEVLEKTADFYRHMLRFRSVAYGEDIVAHLMEGEPTGRRILSVVADKEGALAKLFALTYCGMLTFQGTASREILPRPFMGNDPLPAVQPSEVKSGSLTEEQASVTSELHALAKAASRRGPREEYDAAYGRVSMQPERKVSVTEDRLNIEVVRDEIIRQAENLGVPEAEIREALGPSVVAAPLEEAKEVAEEVAEPTPPAKETVVGIGDAPLDAEPLGQTAEFVEPEAEIKPTLEFGPGAMAEVLEEVERAESGPPLKPTIEFGEEELAQVVEEADAGLPISGPEAAEQGSSESGAIAREAVTAQGSGTAQGELVELGETSWQPIESPLPDREVQEESWEVHTEGPAAEQSEAPIEEPGPIGQPTEAEGALPVAIPESLGDEDELVIPIEDEGPIAAPKLVAADQPWSRPVEEAPAGQSEVPETVAAETFAEAPVAPLEAPAPDLSEIISAFEGVSGFSIEPVVPEEPEVVPQAPQSEVGAGSVPLYVGGQPVGSVEPQPRPSWVGGNGQQPSPEGWAGQPDQAASPMQPVAPSGNVSEADLNTMIDQAMAQAALAVSSSSLPVMPLPMSVESESPELEVDHGGSEGHEKSGESEEDELALAALMSGLPQVPPKPDNPELGTDESIERILEDVYRSMLHRTLYELLNVTPLSPLSAIRDATQRLRNKYAPTQYRGFLMSKRAHRLLKLVREAVDRAEQVLTHLKSRRHYDEMLSTPYPLDRSVWLHQVFHAERDFQAGLKAVSSKEFARAVEMLGRAVTSNSNDPDYVAWRGYALYQKQKSGMWEDPSALGRVRADFEKALSLDPRHNKSLLFLARLEDQLENVEAAMGWYTRLQKIEPGNEEAAEALERLRRVAAEKKLGDPGGWLKFKGMFNKKK